MGKGARRGGSIALAMTAMALLAVPQALGAAFTVNSSDDANDGVCNIAHCSLREAIIAANATEGADVIGFSILSGPQTISPLAGYPALTGATTIDGTTQPGYESTPLIELDGSAAGIETNGLVLGAAGGVIRGLVINDFTEAGIRLADGATVERNYIGVDRTGTVDHGNRDGIRIHGSDNAIGGVGAVGNLISGNDFTGVSVDGDVPTSEQNSVLRNSIFENGLLGIDLEDDGANGVTANDPGDTDTGANGLQNFPVLTSATKNPGSTTVIGSLNSAPSTVYRIDYYASTDCDGSGNGEGERWIGWSELATDGSGNLSIDTGTGLTAPTTVGDSVTATATDPQGNTSEFSACVEVEAAPTRPSSSSTPLPIRASARATRSSARCARRSTRPTPIRASRRSASRSAPALRRSPPPRPFPS